MIKIISLTKKYGKKLVLNNINLTVEDGEIICLLGKNGAGKSTLLNLISKLTNPTSGDIICNNIHLKDNEVLYKRNIAYVPDTFKSFDFLTGNEYINFMFNIYGLPIDKNKTSHYIKLFQLNADINNKIATYSSGTKKKISVVAALLINPSILILDEPEQGLDIYIREVLIRELSFLAKNSSITILISTHDVSIMENLCNKIALLVNGKLIDIDSHLNLKRKYKKSTLGEVFWEVNNLD